MFTIDYKSRTPLYQQIVDQVERLALCGLLPPEEQLPSVRSLAMELSLNPNTIAKAYGELEQRGVIYSLPGRGNFLSADFTGLRQARLERLAERVRLAAREGAEAGLTESQWQELCSQCWPNQPIHKEGA